MRCGGLELYGHLDALSQAQFLDATLRYEGRQREAAVNGDAHMEPDGAEPRDRPLEAVGGERRAGGRGGAPVLRVPPPARRQRRPRSPASAACATSMLWPPASMTETPPSEESTRHSTSVSTPTKRATS